MSNKNAAHNLVGRRYNKTSPLYRYIEANLDVLQAQAKDDKRKDEFLSR